MLLVQADSTGSSVDPVETGGDMEVQQSGGEEDSTAAQTSDDESGNKDGSKDNAESSTPAGQPPKTLGSSLSLLYTFALDHSHVVYLLYLYAFVFAF